MISSFLVSYFVLNFVTLPYSFFFFYWLTLLYCFCYLCHSGSKIRLLFFFFYPRHSDHSLVQRLHLFSALPWPEEGDLLNDFDIYCTTLFNTCIRLCTVIFQCTFKYSKLPVIKYICFTWLSSCLFKNKIWMRMKNRVWPCDKVQRMSY